VGSNPRHGAGMEIEQFTLHFCSLALFLRRWKKTKAHLPLKIQLNEFKNTLAYRNACVVPRCM
jgi:hypothetical protein